MQSIAKIQNFSFQAQELSQKLAEYIPLSGAGYWQLQFDRLSERNYLGFWNIGVSNGKILYSGSKFWTTQSLLKLIQRYVSHTRHESVQAYISQIPSNQQPDQVIFQLKQAGFLNDAQMIEVLRLKVLNDLDTYCLMGAGEAAFIADASLKTQLSIPGFDVEELMQESFHRKALWSQIKSRIPSMNLIPNLDLRALEHSSLPAVQKAHIQSWVESGKSLNSIAIALAKDSLEVAKIFAKLVGAGIVQMKTAAQSVSSTIMIIDDSPLVLKQFQHWVTLLGYTVVVCQSAEAALPTILQANPSAIFIDINMPNISGFELAKQIRQTPQISSIPLVILTGEQKLSNKWRAQWSGCDFLTKPLAANEVSSFQAQLQDLLPRLIESSASAAA